jgi:hypothetical protein
MVTSWDGEGQVPFLSKMRTTRKPIACKSIICVRTDVYGLHAVRRIDTLKWGGSRDDIVRAVS